MFPLFPDHIFDKVNPALEALGMECQCLGGGKIEHNNKEKKIRVFGESTVGFFEYTDLNNLFIYVVLIYVFFFFFRLLAKQTTLCLWRSWRSSSVTMKSLGPMTRNKCIKHNLSAFIWELKSGNPQAKHHFLFWYYLIQNAIFLYFLWVNFVWKIC